MDEKTPITGRVGYRNGATLTANGPVRTVSGADKHTKAVSDLCADGGTPCQRQQQEDNYRSTESSNNSSLERSEMLSPIMEVISGADGRFRLRPIARQRPHFNWGDELEIWQLMCNKDDVHFNERIRNLYSVHRNINASMRCLLLDWIMEVCEAYDFTRNTYHLTINIVDRYLNKNLSFPKALFQMVGVSALLIATKMEEIHSPLVSTLAYISDGACSHDDILKTEMLILHDLKWDLSRITAYNWLYMYVAIAEHLRTTAEAEAEATDAAKETVMPAVSISSCLQNKFSLFSFSKFSRISFLKATELLDLATFDDDSLLFNNHVLATSILYYIFGRKIALYVSRFVWRDLKKCVAWLYPFYLTLKSGSSLAWTGSEHDSQFSSHTIPDTFDEKLNNQLRDVDLKLFAKSQELRFELAKEGIKFSTRLMSFENDDYGESDDDDDVDDDDDDDDDDEDDSDVSDDFEKVLANGNVENSENDDDESDYSTSNSNYRTLSSFGLFSDVERNRSEGEDDGEREAVAELAEDREPEPEPDQGHTHEKNDGENANEEPEVNENRNKEKTEFYDYLGEIYDFETKCCDSDINRNELNSWKSIGALEDRYYTLAADDLRELCASITSRRRSNSTSAAVTATATATTCCTATTSTVTSKTSNATTTSQSNGSRP